MTRNFYLEVQDVSKKFYRRQGIFARGPAFNALDGLSLAFETGGFYGLVGESGCGKTTLARILVGLLAPSEGRVYYQGRDLRDWLKNRQLLFRSKVQMIFQNPFMSLDPKWSVKQIVEEGIQSLNNRERTRRVESAMGQVGLDLECLERMPSAMSGGERQRVAIARALCMQPEFLILDEPTSQLDVSTQAQITGLLADLRHQFSGGILLISHDLAFVSQLAEEVIVLYRGRMVEKGKRVQVLGAPQHEYTHKLLESVPKLPREGG